MEAAASLPRHLLERDLGGAHTSAWATLLHTAWGEWLWLGRWRETTASGKNPADSQSLAELEARWGAIAEQQLGFINGLGIGDLDRRVSYENPPGTAWTYMLREMVRHVVNHSTYHRGQIASLLRRFGTTPPPTDYSCSSMKARHHRRICALREMPRLARGDLERYVTRRWPWRRRVLVRVRRWRGTAPATPDRRCTQLHYA
jgi:uncharacterized damage-inducible protein DinB